MESKLSIITKLVEEFDSLAISEEVNWEKFNLYSIVHHSTAIEGCTLTDVETQLLIDEDITAKGKKFLDHAMVKDNYAALQFILKQGKMQTPLSVDLVQRCNGLVMKNTGGVVNSIMGSFDSSKGDLRLVNVTAGNRRFMDFRKVPQKLTELCAAFNQKMNDCTKNEALIHSFDLQYFLVSIHPFADGNGRTCRLFSNFIQHQFGWPLSTIFKEDKADYYTALKETDEKEDLSIFRTFMLDQYQKMLTVEIEKSKSRNGGNFNFLQ